MKKKREARDHARGTLRGRSVLVALLLVLAVLLSAGSGLYAGASFFAQQAPGVTVTTTILTTTTSWTTSTIWSTIWSTVEGILTTVEYTTSTSTVTISAPDISTRLLLHMDGTDGSRLFADSSAGGHSVTARGAAQIDTAQSKFGGASGLFGSGDYLSIPDSADWAFGSGDFTIDFRVRFAALPGQWNAETVYSQRADDNNRVTILVFNNAGTYQWYFRAFSGGYALVDVARNTNLATNTWYHVAFVRSGNSFMIFQDGTQCGTTLTDSDSIPDFAASLEIGRYGDGSLYLNGWLDEFRISKGVARWTSNFTPPTAPY